MIRTSPVASRKGRVGDVLTAAALATVALANLALPASAQVIAGVDYLVLALGVMGASALVRLPRALKNPAAWGFAIAIMLVSVPGSLAAPLDGYGAQKIQTFVIIAVSLVSASTFKSAERGSRWFLGISLALSLVFAALMFTVSVTTVTGRTSLAGLNPIGVARLTALGMVLLTIAAFGVPRLGALRRFGALLLAGAAGLATLMTDSRGPALAALAVVLAGLLLILSLRRAHVAWLVLTATLVAGGVLISVFSPTSGGAWVTDRGDSGRASLYEEALGIILSSPAGVGWGNFSRASGVQEHPYPHNIYLEFGAEGGVFALAMLLVLTLMALVWSIENYRRSRTYVDLALFATYVYSLINAQVSSDVVGNRMLWIAMALVVAARMKPSVLGRDANALRASGGRVVRGSKT